MNGNVLVVCWLMLMLLVWCDVLQMLMQLKMMMILVWMLLLLWLMCVISMMMMVLTLQLQYI